MFLKPQKKIVKVESDSSAFTYLITCQGKEETEVLCCSKTNKQANKKTHTLITTTKNRTSQSFKEAGF